MQQRETSTLTLTDSRVGVKRFVEKRFVGDRRRSNLLSRSGTSLGAIRSIDRAKKEKPCQTSNI